MTGIVYKSTGSWYWISTGEEILHKCRIKGKFRIKGIKSTNPIAVGDEVDFKLETIGDEEVGVITKIHERKNFIVRKSVNLSKQIHVIASNIDQVFLLVTVKNPLTLTTFIDRFLVTVEAYSIQTIVLFNKIDTYNAEEYTQVQALKKTYEAIGYQCIEVSSIKGTHLNQVKELMKAKVSMFSGHSGVGKTTMINTIEPSLNLRTREISEQHKQGQHTTTFAEMFDLSFGAKIIDTPGIKGFGVVDISKEELGDYFPEFFQLKRHCKFYNCIHVNEPQCAVKEALKEGKISQSRYKSYLQIMQEEEEHYRTDIWE